MNHKKMHITLICLFVAIWVFGAAILVYLCF